MIETFELFYVRDPHERQMYINGGLDQPDVLEDRCATCNLTLYYPYATILNEADELQHVCGLCITPLLNFKSKQ
jgi:hypothetical protein